MHHTFRLTLATALFAFSAAEVQAKTVYLKCTYPGVTRPDVFHNLTIDYDARTVVVVNPPPEETLVDMNGVTAQPAQISDATIVWKIVTRRYAGGNYATHFILNRYTGELAYHDDGTQAEATWTCQAAAAPPPKVKKF